MPFLMTPNKATMSVIGLYNYDNSLFDNLHIPTGVNLSVVINNILDTCAELELLYPDFNYLKNAISYWSARELPLWNKIYEMENADYNPLENYDRYDNEVENTGRKSEGASETSTSSESNSTDNATTTSDGLSKIAGYNSSTLVTNGGTSEIHAQNEKNNAAVESAGETSSTLNENENRFRALHSHGNIGVTTVAQMMRGMLDVLPEVNTVSVIAESFKRRFCLLVY